MADNAQDIVPPGSYTYNGTTVAFTSAQSELLNKALQKIKDEAVILEKLLNDRSEWTSKYNYEQDRLTKISGNCIGLKDYEKVGLKNVYVGHWTNCTQDAENKRSIAGNKLGELAGKIKTSSDFLNKDNPNSYVAQYNNTLLQIQNQIKLQIQAQQANQNTANQNTQNQNSLSQNSPESIAQANALSQQLQEQALKSEEKTRQYILFGFIVFVIVAGAVLVIRKIGV